MDTAAFWDVPMTALRDVPDLDGFFFSMVAYLELHA